MALNAFDVGFAISVFDRASGPLNRIRSSYRTLNLETQKYEKRMQAGFKLLAGGYVAAASGIAAMGGALKLAQKAADFQLQIDQLKLVADQSGIARSQLQGLEATVQKVAQKTTFSVTDITKASKAFVQRGLVDVGVSERGLEGAAIFSEISLGQIDIVKSSEIASQAIKAFRKEGESNFAAMNRTLGIMAYGANTTSLTFDKLPLTMGRIARAGSISGLSLEELSMAVGKATDKLGSYRIAGTAVATLFEGLAKQGKEKRLLDMLGLQGTQIKDVGLVKIIDTIRDQMVSTGKSADEMAKILSNKLEIGAKNIQVLTSSAEEARKSGQSFGVFVKNAAEAGSKGLDFLKEMVKEKYYETLGGQLKLLEGKFENFQINLGKTFAPALETITRIFASEGGLLDTISSFLTNKNNQKVVAKAAESFLKGAFMTAITGMTALLTGAVLLLGPVIAPMIPLMTALGGAVYVLTNNLADSFGGFKQLGFAIGDAAKVLITGDTSFLGPKTEDRFQNANKIVKSITTSFEFLKGVFEGIMTVIRPLVSMVETLVGALKSLAGVFGGEGSGGAGKLLGQVLAAAFLFKGARGLLGGAKGLLGVGGARGGAAAAAAGARGGGGLALLTGIGSATKTTFTGAKQAAAVRAQTRLPVPGPVTGAVAPLTAFQKGRISTAMAPGAAASRSTRMTAMMKGARLGGALSGGLSVAGLVGGAALGQKIAPDNALLNLAVQGATFAAVDAIPVKKIGASVAGAAASALPGVAASIGALGSTPAAAALTSAGPAGWIAATAAFSFAVGTAIDKATGLSDWLSDFAIAGQEATTAIRGFAKGMLTDRKALPEDITISQESIQRRFAQLGGSSSAQARAFMNEYKSMLAVIDINKTGLEQSQMKLDQLIARRLGAGATSEDISKRRSEILKSGDFSSLGPEGAKLKETFNEVRSQIEQQRTLLKQFAETNKLNTQKEEELRNKTLENIAAGINAADAQTAAAKQLAEGNFDVVLNDFAIGKMVRTTSAETATASRSGTDAQDGNPTVSVSPMVMAGL